MQALVSVPALRNFYTQPQPQKGRQLEKGSIGAALQEVVQTVYGALHSEPPSACLAILRTDAAQ